MSLSTELTPQERLALSRKALINHMSGMSMKRHAHRADENQGAFETESGESTPAGGSGTWNIFKYAFRLWWHNHPASAVVELAHPLLEDYAHVHPFKLLGFSAATGATLVVLKPWRMISAHALLAGLKSSGLYAALLSEKTAALRQPPSH